MTDEKKLIKELKSQLNELEKRVSGIEDSSLSSKQGFQFFTQLIELQTVFSGRLAFLKEVIYRSLGIGPHLSIPKEEIDNLFPENGKAKEIFLEELEAFNKRRHK